MSVNPVHLAVFALGALSPSALRSQDAIARSQRVEFMNGAIGPFVSRLREQPGKGLCPKSEFISPLGGRMKIAQQFTAGKRRRRVFSP